MQHCCSRQCRPIGCNKWFWQLFFSLFATCNVHVLLQIEMTMGMPAIQEMPDEESAQNSPARAGNSPNKVTGVAPQPAAMNGEESKGSKTEEHITAALEPKAGKLSLADGEDPKHD